MTIVTRDKTASVRQRRMRDRRSRGFFIVGVEVCRSDLEMLCERGYLEGDQSMHHHMRSGRACRVTAASLFIDLETKSLAPDPFAVVRDFDRYAV